MKNLLIKKDEILRGLSKVSKTIGTNAATKGICIQCDGNGNVILTSHNNKMQTFSKIKGEGPATAFLVDGRTFSSLITKAADMGFDDFKLEVIDSTLEIKAGEMLVTKLSLLDIETFINFDMEKETKATIKVQGEPLQEAIYKTTFAVAVSDERPILQAIHCEIAKEQKLFCMTALDGYRISHKEFLIDDFQGDEDVTINIPGNHLGFISSELEGEIVIQVGEKIVSIATGDTIYKVLLIEGNYIEYRKMFPTEYETNVNVNLKEFLKAVNVCGVICDSKKKLVKLTIKDETMTVSATNEKGNTDINLKIKQVGKDIEICFNIKYIEDIKYFDSEEVILNLSGPELPAIIMPADNTPQMYFILPVRQ